MGVNAAEMVRRAEALARSAHEGQVDKAGKPYAEHPARIAASVAGDPVLESIAWLHDVVEDTPVTLADLRAAGFPEEVVAGVAAITQLPDESRPGYYARVAANSRARIVKLADIADNSDPARLAVLDEASRARLEQKYASARAQLG